MHKTMENVPAIKLAGTTARTSNASEINPDTAKIGTTMQRFFTGELQSKIPNTKKASRIFSVYTDYASDENGEYTYFPGVEVTSFDHIEEGLETLVIPPQHYAKFTSNPGTMPAVVIDMWQKIWKMKSTELEGERAYLADFEIYDERSAPPDNAVVDIYIGLKSTL